MTARRFLALANVDAAIVARTRQRAEPLGLQLRFEAHGLTFFAPPDAPVRILPGKAGLFWGETFEPIAWPSNASHGHSTAADRLTRQTWGDYVAFLLQGVQIVVVRSPMGQTGCYHGLVGEGRFFCSEAELAVSSQLAGTGIHTDTLAEMLLYREARGRQTALCDFRELLPGSALAIGQAPETEWLAWSPARHLEVGTTDFAEAVGAVRRASLACVAAWASRFEHPLVELSGGLDSSIVAAGLAHAGHTFSCLTYEASGADMNEVEHARRVAEALHAPFAAARPDEAGIDIGYSMAGHLPNPHARSFNQATDRASVAEARRTGADGFFSGAGGDNVFCYLASAAPVIDRFFAEGPGAAWRTAVDVARVAGVSPWRAVRNAARRIVVPTEIAPWIYSPELLAPALIHELRPPPIHPWMEACARAPRGKRAHVASLLRILNYLECNSRAGHGPFIAPLLSQPLVETCLSLPSWLWFEGGVNRAVARAAYAELLPAAILARRTKGSFVSFVSRIVEANRDRVRAELLEGFLSQEKLLDRPAIERLFRGHGPIDGLMASRLLGLMDAEAWTHSWRGRSG